MEQSRVKVEIGNQIYTINGDASPEYIIQLAEYVNNKMKEVLAHNASCNTAQTAILVAMNIADEYYQLKKIRTNMDGVMQEKTAALISMLDEGLIGDIFTRINA